MFWSFIFPLILYFILTSVFGSLYGDDTQGISFRVGIVREESLSGLGMILDKVIEDISSENGPFVKKEYGSVDEALIDLKEGKQDIVLVIPEGTSAKIASAAVLQTGEVALRVHYISGKDSSSIASNVLSEIIDEVNLEIRRQSGGEYVDVVTEAKTVSAREEKPFDYREYIFPGVALMMILSVALFNSPIGLIQYRVSGVNKKLYTTPLKPLEYFAGHFAKLIFTMLISLTLLYLTAIFVYNVRGPILDIRFILTLLFSMVVTISFGLMIASFSKKLSTVTVLGQTLYQLMMFLGGLYFPVFHLPWGIRWLVYALPTTYLVELSRRVMGYQFAPVSLFWLILVPIIWTAFSTVIFVINFKKVMGYE